MNFELETKVGGQMEDSVLAKDISIENHRKLCETFEKMVDVVKATDSHIVPRFQEPSNEKLGTAKDKMLAIEECTNIKARLSIKTNKVQPSIKQNKVLAKVDVHAETRDDLHACTRVDVRAKVRDGARAKVRDGVRVCPRVNIPVDTRDNTCV